MPERLETYQVSSQSSKAETSERIAYVANSLLARSMHQQPVRKHKWATGKEKWDALQREGARAASGQRAGRPAKAAIGLFMSYLSDYVAMDEQDPRRTVLLSIIQKNRLKAELEMSLEMIQMVAALLS